MDAAPKIVRGFTMKPSIVVLANSAIHEAKRRGHDVKIFRNSTEGDRWMLECTKCDAWAELMVEVKNIGAQIDGPLLGVICTPNNDE